MKNQQLQSKGYLMISSTQTIRIISINETFDPQGVKIVYGQGTFSHYSKDGLVEDSIAYRAKGAAAVSVAEAGVNASGVAIGYLDIEVKDSDKGYKNKICTLVIRSFIPTTTANTTFVPTTSAPISPPASEENSKQLVNPVPTVAASNGYVNTTDSSNIPF
ncbi:hypothetical protein [Scytonema sp. PRP1]|uniref:hypothetical protein n=1 Tax=Scytonema sp. PRP1 TaxID=3120513 RepID=UPI00300C9EA1